MINPHSNNRHKNSATETDILQMNNTMKHIHLIAICGTAMGSIAAMLKSQGYHITGSDEHVYPPMSTFLEEQGIHIYHGFDEKNLQPHPDLVIIGNAMSRGNPEVEYVLENKIPYTSLPLAIKDFFIRGKHSIVVSGTHGIISSEISFCDKRCMRWICIVITNGSSNVVCIRFGS